MTNRPRTSETVTHHLSRVTRNRAELSPPRRDTTRGASLQVVTHVTRVPDLSENTLVTGVTGVSNESPIHARTRPRASVTDMSARVTCHREAS